MKKTYLIIGSSAAGIAAITAISKNDPESQIICVTKDKNTPYNTCFLVDYLAKEKTIEDIQLPINKNVSYLFDAHVELVFSEKNYVILRDNTKIFYDKLLIATGAKPKIVKELKNLDISGVFNFHNLSDVNYIKKYIQENLIREAVIVGSGLTGIECADAMHKLGLKINLIEYQNKILPKFLDQQASDWVTNKLTQITVRIRETLEEILLSGNRVSSVKLASNIEISSQIVIIALGVEPAIEFAKNSGILMQDGIITDIYLKTNIDNIYAAGDCTINSNYTWADAIAQGFVAGTNMCGDNKIYKRSVLNIASKFFGLNFFAFGDINYNNKNIIETNNNSHLIYFLNEHNVILGFLILGDMHKKINDLKRAVMKSEVLNWN